MLFIASVIERRCITLPISCLTGWCDTSTRLPALQVSVACNLATDVDVNTVTVIGCVLVW